MKRLFTLIELLVVIGVIAILAALILPSFLKAKKLGLKTSCASNLKQIGAAIESYAQDNDNFFPLNCTSYEASETERTPIKRVLQPYVDGDEVFHCPADNQLFVYEGHSYLWNRYQIELPGNELIGKEKYDTGIQGVISASSFPLMSDGGPYHGKAGNQNSVNVLYTNGRVDTAVGIPFL